METKNLLEIIAVLLLGVCTILMVQLYHGDDTGSMAKPLLYADYNSPAP